MERVRRKYLLLILLSGAIILVALYAMVKGAYDMPVEKALLALLGKTDNASRIVVFNIRLPRVVAALCCGWGLSLSGLCIQTLLRNPLGAPMTLGISHGAAFGAAVAIVVLGAGMACVTTAAFVGGMSATLVILLLARFKRLSPAAIILAGVALHSLFLSGTYLIQYIAAETELAMVVFWAFGDVARSNWKEIAILASAVVLFTIYMMFLRWDLNALASGDETAKGMGVNVERIRISGMAAATLMAALATTFHGIIGFIGLIAPHAARFLVGEDHRFMIPFSAVLGALLLLTADTLGRTVIGSGSLPVGVITSFLGAPLFLYLLIRSNQ